MVNNSANCVTSHSYFLQILIGLMCVLSSCAITDERVGNAESPPRIAITPFLLTLTYEGTCEENPSLLETWIGTSLAMVETIDTMWIDLPTVSPSELLSMIERLVIMRNGIGSLAAPDCAAQAHAILVTLIDTSLETFQSVYNAESVNLLAIQSVVDERRSQLSVLFDSLLEQLQIVSGFE